MLVHDERDDVPTNNNDNDNVDDHDDDVDDVDDDIGMISYLCDENVFIYASDVETETAFAHHHSLFFSRSLARAVSRSFELVLRTRVFARLHT